MNNVDFPKGTRVRLSEYAKEKKLHSRHSDRKGTVIGFGSRENQNCRRVRWDGTKGVALIHLNFIEAVPTHPLAPTP